MTTQYFRLQAPYPAVASTVLLPQPEIGNNLGLNASVSVITMADGSRRSFVKRAGNTRRHRWTFEISSQKYTELEDFIKRYRGDTFLAVWRDRRITGRLNLNPVEFAGETGDALQVTIELVEQ